MSKEENKKDTKYHFYRRQEFTCEILSALNLIRTNPNEYISTHPSLSETEVSIIKLLSPTRPLSYSKNLTQSSDELLNYLIFTDKGDHVCKISDPYYHIKNRLSRFGFYTGKYSEIVLYDKNTVESIMNTLITEEKYFNDIINPFMNYISISIDNLPSDALCVVIDLVYEFKGTGDLVEKTLYESNYSPKNIDTKSYVILPNEKEQGNVREFVYTTLPDEQKMPSEIPSTGSKRYIQTTNEEEVIKQIKGNIYPYRRSFNILDKNLVKEDFQVGYEVLVLTKDFRGKKHRKNKINYSPYKK